MVEYENLQKANRIFEEEYQADFKTFLSKGWYILGEQVGLFEKEFAEYCGSGYCIGVASGLDALYLSLVALDLPLGSEIIVPSNTYIATILSIINAGLKPILVEPDIRTYNIDPGLITEKITTYTKAILVVHLYGKPCEMERIMTLAASFDLHVIEDCAQAHGAEINNSKVGTFGIFGAFSFYPTKNLGCLGDGGAITTNDKRMAEKLKALRNYGSLKKYYNEYIGINSRLDELQACFLRIKLRHLDDINQHKNKLASIYFENLDQKKVILPVKNESGKEVYHIFPIRHADRNRLKQYLEAKSIKTEIHYPVAPQKQKAYEHYFDGDNFPISDEIHNTELSLPISFFHTEKDIHTVTDAINNFQL